MTNMPLDPRSERKLPTATEAVYDESVAEKMREDIIDRKAEEAWVDMAEIEAEREMLKDDPKVSDLEMNINNISSEPMADRGDGVPNVTYIENNYDFDVDSDEN